MSSSLLFECFQISCSGEDSRSPTRSQALCAGHDLNKVVESSNPASSRPGGIGSTEWTPKAASLPEETWDETSWGLDFPSERGAHASYSGLPLPGEPALEEPRDSLNWPLGLCGSFFLHWKSYSGRLPLMVIPNEPKGQQGTGSSLCCMKTGIRQPVMSCFGAKLQHGLSLGV